MKIDKILFICPGYPQLGGVETVTGLLADFFLSMDRKVSILSLKAGNRPESHRHDPYIVEMPGPLNAPDNLSFIDHYIRSHGINAVFNQGVFSQTYLQASAHPQVVFVNTLHSRPFWEIPQFVNSAWKANAKNVLRHLLGLLHPNLTHPRIKNFYRNQIETVNWYVVLDEAFKKELEVKLYQGVPQPNIVVIPNPLPLVPSSAVEKKKEVLYVGRLTDEPKRVDRLLRIWSNIAELVPEWRLIVVGDGPARPELEALARELKLKNVSFKGFQDTAPYYRSASVLCLTSTYEGSPMVIPEAQSYGTVPIVFGSVLSMYSLIDDEMNGLVVPAFDEQAFAEDLYKLMRDEKRWAYLSENAVKKVQDRSVERIGRQWLALLEG